MKNEFRYQLLIKAKDRRALNTTLQGLRSYALQHKWNATALVIDVTPYSAVIAQNVQRCRTESAGFDALLRSILETRERSAVTIRVLP